MLLFVSFERNARPSSQAVRSVRDVVQVLQGILRRAQAGAGVGKCIASPHERIDIEKSRFRR